MRVMKFGGGCLREGKDFRRAAGILAGTGGVPVAVVSAAFGITDELKATALRAGRGRKDIPRDVSGLLERHFQLAGESIEDRAILEQVFVEISGITERLHGLLRGIARAGRLTERSEARVLSFGERLSARLLAGAVRDRGRRAEARDADAIGLVTDRRSRGATALLPEVTRRFATTLRPLIDQGSVPIVTGFFGCTPQGEITIFGRNGTDYSAAVAARCLGADRLVIWKDSDGFMSADPALVADARRIPALSLDEAAELAYFGARILHPRTLEPLARERIPVEIRNVASPASPGTLLDREGCRSLGVIKSVACNREVAILRVRGPGVGSRPGIIADAGRRLCDGGINILSILTAQTCINLLIARQDGAAALEALCPIENGVIAAVDLIEDIALVAVVGRGLARRPGLASRIFSAVAEAGINVEMSASGATDAAAYLIVKARAGVEAVRAVHREFF